MEPSPLLSEITVAQFEEILTRVIVAATGKNSSKNEISGAEVIARIGSYLAQDNYTQSARAGE